jgi:TolB-like protein/DNA-binding winged helix-turn-helix (wHTH) protein/Tfp pilus assembly protein PilF
MDEAPPPRGKFRFGEVILDLSSAEIERGGVRQRLPDQAFEVLEVLTSNPGTVVTREELIARLWPKTTFIDTEAGLNSAVKKLRASLGDDADHPRFIETVPRRGYRFIAAIEPSVLATTAPPPGIPAAPEAVSSATVEAAEPPPRTRRYVLIATLAVASAIALVAWLGRGAPSSRAPVLGPADLATSPSGNVAVLPFLNLTGDPQRDDLALGFAESILHELAQLRGVNVIAHTSSFAFRNKAGDVREIGRKLNARYVLEGSLQGSAQRMRITTQLIDTATGTHLWSQSFDRPTTDLFAIQDEISHEVAKALRVSVTDADGEPLRSSGTHNLDAWLAFQQGRELAATRRVANLDAAVTSLENAVQLDPQFARAYVELAEAYLLRSRYSASEGTTAEVRDRRRAANDAVAAVARALAIDPKLGDALVVRGHAASYVEDYVGAETDLRAGLALSPNNARGYQLLGELLVDELGRDEEGMALIGRARLLDPLEPRAPYYLGIVAYLRSNFADAQRWFLAALELRPDYAPALGRLSMVSLSRGQFADAVKYAERALRADPRSSWVRDELVEAYWEIGEIESVRRLLRSASTADPIVAAELLFLDGDYRRAGALVYADPDRSGFCAVNIVPFIVLEHARVTKDYTRARGFFEQNMAGLNKGPATASLRGDLVVKSGAEYAASLLAQIMQLSGDRARARHLLETTLAQLDRAEPPLALERCVNVGRTRARVLALLGRDGEALDTLKRALLRENSWYYGWYLFDRDSAFAHLQTNSEFQALRAAYRAHIEAEQRKLAELRASGLVGSIAAPRADSSAGTDRP